MTRGRDLRQPGGARHNELAAALAVLPEQTLQSLWLGALLTVRLGEGALAHEAQAVLAALARLRAETIEGEVATYEPGPARHDEANALAPMLDVGALRHALEHELKLTIGYVDAKGRATRRTVWPLDVEDYGPNGAMLAWCEKRGEFRNFRFDRVTALSIVRQRSDAPRSVMLAIASALQRLDHN